ncbi:MAG: DNA polymerase Y family protein, partial [Planctomycetota bacterium]
MLLVADERQRRVVAQCCERAHARGARIGMPLAEARALFDGEAARIEPHEPERDRSALRSLAAWAHWLSPTIAVDEPDGLLLDVLGCGVVFGGETVMVQRARERLGRLGFQ